MLTNRLSSLNGKIPLAWLYNSIDSFKMKCKQVVSVSVQTAMVLVYSKCCCLDLPQTRLVSVQTAMVVVHSKCLCLDLPWTRLVSVQTAVAKVDIKQVSSCAALVTWKVELSQKIFPRFGTD